MVMILNALSITTIFVGIVSAVLMTWGGITSSLLSWRWGKATTTEERTKLEDRSYLVLLIAVVILVVRLLNWPLFYGTLQSFIPDIEGAMCIFGVTQVRPIFTKFQEFLKPVVFFLIGAWILVHMLDRATKTYPLMRRKLFFLSILSIFVVVDSIGDAVLMMTIRPGAVVSCCTTVTDILARPTKTTPESILGPGYGHLLETSYFVANFVLIGLVGFMLWRKKLETPSRWKRISPGLIFLFAIVNGLIFILSQIEVIAPKIMHLPYHHCLYCLWQYVPDSIAMYLFFILGTFAIGWAFTTDAIGRKGEAADILPRYLKAIYGFALFCLSASLVMVIIHLVVG
jgi:hypothetical protein